MAHMKDFSLFGRDLFGNKVDPMKQGPLGKRFIFPPFSVLDQRSGNWQERKRAWMALGIKSEVGRGNNLLGMSDTVLALQQKKGLLKGGIRQSKTNGMAGESMRAEPPSSTRFSAS